MMKNLVVISPPDMYDGEVEAVTYMVNSGLSHYHFRKPGWNQEAYVHMLSKWDADVRDKIVLHQHFDVVHELGLHGVHLHENSIDTVNTNDYFHRSYSAHSITEINNLQEYMGYVFLSPIFDSISKTNYQSAFSSQDLLSNLPTCNHNVFALGGIDDTTIEKAFDVGFDGVACLGGIWENPRYKNPIDAYNKMKLSIEQYRPKVMTIAGFDPSGGAGVLADIKTFEQHQVLGFGINTANTIQNESEFYSVNWMKPEEILSQIDAMVDAHVIHYVKIGIIENLNVLQRIVKHLKSKHPNMFILWDPILATSSGFDFHKDVDEKTLVEVSQQIDLITPNRVEFEALFEDVNISSTVLLKGGHNPSENTADILKESHGEIEISGSRIDGNKHGTGCVLSSAIIANLSKGVDLKESCENAKHYVEKLILSNSGELGYHA